MTLASRKRTLIGILVLAILLHLSTAVFFIRTPPDLSISELFALIGSAAAVFVSFLASVLFIHLFRRSPSVSVFFMTLSFLLLSLDGLKYAQVLAADQALSELGVILSRILIAGNLLWVSALAGAGLYAGGVRMQRHGTAIVFVTALVATLAASIPLDTGMLPVNLVHSAVLRASLDVIIALFATMAVLNYVYTAFNDRSTRRLWSALSVGLIAVGREGLFHWIEPPAVLGSTALLVAGATIFALRHYREQILG